MKTHNLKSTDFFCTIATRDPALRIDPGDSIKASTLDARGNDSNDVFVGPIGNPMTGPIFVESAEPGDALVVRFSKLVPNRRIGRTTKRIAPHILDPGRIEQYLSESDGLIEWEIDATRGVAVCTESLENGTSRAESAGSTDRERADASADAEQKPLEVKLHPMLGCFGTAPPKGQSISTATSGPYGGNMDYRGFCEGVTVMLPVFVPGALFYFGDGHAAQGAGEILGMGIEISFDVELGFGLRKDVSLGWPRAFDERYIMTVGNARPLDQALQHATSEMITWLSELGLSTEAAQVLLGMTADYDVGNVFDPAYTVVCKVLRTALEAQGIELGSAP